MNPFEMVVLIVIVGAAASVVRTWLRRTASAAPAHDPQAQVRLQQLEERVKALEAVVTDHGYDLKREFRELEKTA